MTDGILKWRLYEVSSTTSSLNGVMLRGRIRKYGLGQAVNVLVENTEDIKGGVRFATLSERDGEVISKYVKSVIVDAEVRLVQKDLPNPVLSKLKVNSEERYTV